VIPYHDENEAQRTAVVTLAIIAVNVLVWLFIQGAGSEIPLAAAVCNLGLIPGELTGQVGPGASFPMGRGLACVTDQGPQAIHLLTSMFLHGSWMHLIGNMWFLWLFGNNVEDAMTRVRFLVFYLVCGLAAGLLQVGIEPKSIVPMVGASGAISGIMGAYLVLYPRVRVFTLVPLGFFITTVALPAWVMLIYWGALQVLGGLSRAVGDPGGGVAFWAHVGGFAAGVVLVRAFVRSDHLSDHRAGHWRPNRVGWS
jgi:membrane associated rhomboid family serine protease